MQTAGICSNDRIGTAPFLQSISPDDGHQQLPISWGMRIWQEVARVVANQSRPVRMRPYVEQKRDWNAVLKLLSYCLTLIKLFQIWFAFIISDLRKSWTRNSLYATERLRNISCCPQRISYRPDSSFRIKYKVKSKISLLPIYCHFWMFIITLFPLFFWVFHMN